MAPLSLRAAVLALVLGLAPATLRAQLVDQKVLGQEGARRALAAAEAEARKNGWRVSVAVVDASGELMAFSRMDEAALTSVAIAQAKARTAARFRRPTKALDSALAGGRTALLAFEGIMPVEGGVPIVVGGRVVGGVGVSGVTSQQDAVAAQAGAAAVTP
ncbi:MAG TPA: heme-binding protein [Gemmatirosa sp.]|nr:heme-binding protein [Gemmatirosa sp.]